MSTSDKENIQQLTSLLQERETSLLEKQEELDSQRGMLSAAIDELVAKNKNLEETLVKLKERNSELQQLLYQSSHGLRSPLSSIQGVINLMDIETISSSLVEYKGHVDVKISHMLEILNSLTTLATLINEEINLEIVDIHSVISDCVRYCSPLAVQNNTTIDMISGTGLSNFRSDPNLLRSILRQVVMNGVIFRDTGKPGYVRITPAVIKNTLLITVQDDGEGIAPDIAPKIFNMFVRGSGKSGGSGLGLYIAKKATELLKGSIEFSRTEGKTIFVIAIPQGE